MDAYRLNLPNEWLSQVIVCNRPEYIVSYAQRGPCTFVHIAVFKWTPTVKRRLAIDADACFALHGGPLYAVAQTDKQKRFDAMFGFFPTGVVTADGEVLIKKE